MEKKILLILVMAVVIGCVLTADYEHLITFKMMRKKENIRLAIEFVDHAACAFIAKRKGFYEANGLNVSAFECYITGPALAAALAREDIDAAYMCLIPAICAYANAKVPLKIVAGIHKYGYALIVNSSKISTVKDLENPDVRIACVTVGSPPDVLLHVMIEKYKLDGEKILSKVQYMAPPKALLALQGGLVDAAFLPEQYPSMGEKLGFKVLLTAQDLWPNMLGGVLVVKSSLIEHRPEVVKKLVKATIQGTEYIYSRPEDAARIVAEELQVAGKRVLPSEIAEIAAKLEITPDVISRSLAGRVICSNDIDVQAVQDTIDYLAKLGYINWFKAEEILDLSFLEEV
jgi:NitT/TauT family transport system substrate-binding protein